MTSSNVEMALTAGLTPRRICAQIIQTAPGMRLDIAKWFVFLCQVGQHLAQQRMFVHISQIARMEMMLVRQHWRWVNPRQAVCNGAKNSLTVTTASASGRWMEQLPTFGVEVLRQAA